MNTKEDFKSKMIQWFNENKGQWIIDGDSWKAFDREKGFHSITLDDDNYIYYQYCGGKDGWSENIYEYDFDCINRLENISSQCKYL